MRLGKASWTKVTHVLHPNLARCSPSRRRRNLPKACMSSSPVYRFGMHYDYPALLAMHEEALSNCKQIWKTPLHKKDLPPRHEGATCHTWCLTRIYQETAMKSNCSKTNSWEAGPSQTKWQPLLESKDRTPSATKKLMILMSFHLQTLQKKHPRASEAATLSWRWMYEVGKDHLHKSYPCFASKPRTVFPLSASAKPAQSVNALFQELEKPASKMLRQPLLERLVCPPSKKRYALNQQKVEERKHKTKIDHASKFPTAEIIAFYVWIRGQAVSSTSEPKHKKPKSKA